MWRIVFWARECNFWKSISCFTYAIKAFSRSFRDDRERMPICSATHGYVGATRTSVRICISSDSTNFAARNHPSECQIISDCSFRRGINVCRNSSCSHRSGVALWGRSGTMTSYHFFSSSSFVDINQLLSAFHSHPWRMSARGFLRLSLFCIRRNSHPSLFPIQLRCISFIPSDQSRVSRSSIRRSA